MTIVKNCVHLPVRLGCTVIVTQGIFAYTRPGSIGIVRDIVVLGGGYAVGVWFVHLTCPTHIAKNLGNRRFTMGISALEALT